MIALIGKAVAYAVVGGVGFVGTVLAFSASADATREALRLANARKDDGETRVTHPAAVNE